MHTRLNDQLVILTLVAALCSSASIEISIQAPWTGKVPAHVIVLALALARHARDLRAPTSPNDALHSRSARTEHLCNVRRRHAVPTMGQHPLRTPLGHNVAEWWQPSHDDHLKQRNNPGARQRKKKTLEGLGGSEVVALVIKQIS